MLDRVAGDIAAARALPTLPPWQAPRECGEDDPAAFTDGVTRILDYLAAGDVFRSEEHTSELQSLMRIPYAVFCVKTKRGHVFTAANKTSIPPKPDIEQNNHT